MNKSRIRQAIELHHGGFKDATDAQVMTLWNSLGEETKKEYLEAVRERKANDADSDQARPNVQGGSKHRRKTSEG